jgi:hypothetical protein
VLFGRSFLAYTALVVPVGIAQILQASSSGYAIIVKADRRVRALLLCRVLNTGTALVMAPILGSVYGVLGAAWGLAAGPALGALATIALGLRSQDIQLRRSTPASAGT